MNDKLSKLEAVLFAFGEPVNIRKIGGILEIKEEEVSQDLEELKKYYIEQDSGIVIFEHEGSYELVTSKKHSELIEKILKTEIDEDLTPAATEIMAIISYLGPISRSSIEYIRGVNSSFSLRTLMMRGLIERIPHPDKSNAYLYRPTADILKRLGVSKMEELPEFVRYRELKKMIERNDETGE